MKQKIHKIDLRPEDFENTEYSDKTNCALAKAMKRHFNEQDCTCDQFTCTIWKGGEYNSTIERMFKIKDWFVWEDYQFIEKEYTNSECDTIYYVTLIEN